LFFFICPPVDNISKILLIIIITTMVIFSLICLRALKRIRVRNLLKIVQIYYGFVHLSYGCNNKNNCCDDIFSLANLNYWIAIIHKLTTGTRIMTMMSKMTMTMMTAIIISRFIAIYQHNTRHCTGYFLGIKLNYGFRFESTQM